MAKISKEEILNIARMSHLDIHEDEIGPLKRQLESVLSYAERVSEIAAVGEDPSNKNINMYREDVVVKSDSQRILEQAPDCQEDYFVVPSILDKK